MKEIQRVGALIILCITAQIILVCVLIGKQHKDTSKKLDKITEQLKQTPNENRNKH